MKTTETNPKSETATPTTDRVPRNLHQAIGKAVHDLIEMSYVPSEDCLTTPVQCTAEDCDGREAHEDNPTYLPTDEVDGFHSSIAALWYRLGTKPGDKDSIICQPDSKSWQNSLVKKTKEEEQCTEREAYKIVGKVCAPWGEVLKRLQQAYINKADPVHQEMRKKLESVLTSKVPSGCALTDVELTWNKAWFASDKTLTAIVEDLDYVFDVVATLKGGTETNKESLTKAEEILKDFGIRVKVSELSDEQLNDLRELQVEAKGLFEIVVKPGWDGGFPRAICKEAADQFNTRIKGAAFPARKLLPKLIKNKLARDADHSHQNQQKAATAKASIREMLAAKGQQIQ